MTGYIKLFGTILDSTIWSESKETKLLWITMLAMCGREGIVEASIPGLAERSRLTLEETEEALKRLESPDKYSRTKEHEGRRIKTVDGGWLILNHAKYRLKLSEDERRAYKAAKQKEYRQRDKALTEVRGQAVDTGGQMCTMLTQAEADAEADADTKEKGEGKDTSRNCSTPPSLMIKWEKSLERLNKRLDELKDADLPHAVAERKALKASRKVLLDKLGIPA